MDAELTTVTGNQPSGLTSLCLAITEHAPLPMATVEGASHIVRYVNPAFCRLMDKPTQQLVGKPFRQLLPEKDKCLMLLDRVYRTGKPESRTEAEHSNPDPDFWTYTMWPVMADERPVGAIIQVTETAEVREKMLAMNEALIIGSVRQHELADVADKLSARLTAEIAEHKRTEVELAATKEEINRHAQRLEKVVKERTAELRETIGELEGFSYSLSHDMRAPLRAMQSFASYLVDEYSGKLDEQGANYLHLIMRSAVRLDRLVQDVLSYTRILNSPLPMERVDLDRLVRDIIETYPNGQPIKPKIQIKGKLPKVMANQALLTQCVSNLLGNGAKFVAPGTTPRLEISAEVIEKSKIRVWFKDNGIGIAPENHERIFQLFQRIHAPEEYDGTGIGLSIVRKAIERMGAQIGFESKVGKGSRFWIQLEKG